MKDIYSITSLHKLFLLSVLIFYNTACGGYYDNNNNPFKASGQCDDDIYSYSKEDLADEEFGKIGVAVNTKDYPRAGINKTFTHNDERNLSIQGSFASLCKNSIINKVKIELHNNYGQVKTYYPSISNGYYGDILLEIDMNKDQETRCFFNETDMIVKTWARDENGNTYYANKYSKWPNVNVGSGINWNTKYKYEYRNEYKQKYIDTSIQYESAYKTEHKEVSGKVYATINLYTYTYLYEYTYIADYKYKYPVEMSIYGDNDYPGEYFEMFINIATLGTEKRYKISNDKREVNFTLSNNAKMKADNTYDFQISVVEKLNNCNIESRLSSKLISIPSGSIESIENRKLISAKRTLTNTKKHYDLNYNENL